MTTSGFTFIFAMKSDSHATCFPFLSQGRRLSWARLLCQRPCSALRSRSSLRNVLGAPVRPGLPSPALAGWRSGWRSSRLSLAAWTHLAMQRSGQGIIFISWECLPFSQFHAHGVDFQMECLHQRLCHLIKFHGEYLASLSLETGWRPATSLLRFEELIELGISSSRRNKDNSPKRILMPAPPLGSNIQPDPRLYRPFSASSSTLSPPR